MAAADPIRQKRQVKSLLTYYLKKKNPRNHALIVMGIFTALRISDLLSLTWENVYDFKAKRFRSHIHLTEKKTGKAKSVALNAQATHALSLLFHSLKEVKSGAFLFAGNRKNRAAISRVQAWRIIRQAAAKLRIAGVISCHSLRKTFGYHAWKNKAPIPVIMDIYNHSSFAITQRYLGICQDDRDKVYLSMHFTA